MVVAFIRFILLGTLASPVTFLVTFVTFVIAFISLVLLLPLAFKALHSLVL